MNSDPVGVSISRSNLENLLSRHLYELGYARRPGEYISHLVYGPFHDDDTFPVHFWIDEDRICPEGREVFLETKGTKNGS